MGTVVHAALLSAVAKHTVGGVVAVVVGAVLLLYGLYRVSTRAVGAALITLAGAAIVVVGILLLAHVIHR